MAEATLLIGDIGGTNARFACANTTSPGFDYAATVECADFPSVEAAVRHYIDIHELPNPDVVCLAAAGPLIRDAINVTNNHWHIEPDDLAKEFNTDRVQLLNDFAAVAYAIPSLSSEDYVSIGLPTGGPLSDEFNVAIIGPGTGLSPRF